MQKQQDEFRAAELVEKTGIPRTTLHYYLREGLLPPPKKTSRNSAMYSRAHVERIRLIQWLRSPACGPLSVARVHRVLDRMEKGVSVDVALQMESLMGLEGQHDAERWPAAAMATHFGVPLDAVEAMVRLGLLIPDPFGRAGGFTTAEGRLAQALHQVVEETSLTLEDLEPIARLFAELSHLEATLRDRVVRHAQRGEENALATLTLLRAAGLLHPYLISRTMERQIAERRGSMAVESQKEAG